MHLSFRFISGHCSFEHIFRNRALLDWTAFESDQHRRPLLCDTSMDYYSPSLWNTRVRMHFVLMMLQGSIRNRANGTRLFLGQMWMGWWQRCRNRSNDWAGRLGDRLVGIDLLQGWA